MFSESVSWMVVFLLAIFSVRVLVIFMHLVVYPGCFFVSNASWISNIYRIYWMYILLKVQYAYVLRSVRSTHYRC